MRQALLAAVVLAIPRAAFACPVCFGQSDSPLAKATNMGIFLMLAVVAVVLASFGTFFIHLARRARLAAGTNADIHGTPVNAMSAGRPLSRSEGTM